MKPAVLKCMEAASFSKLRSGYKGKILSSSPSNASFSPGSKSVSNSAAIFCNSRLIAKKVMTVLKKMNLLTLFFLLLVSLEEVY